MKFSKNLLLATAIASLVGCGGGSDSTPSASADPAAAAPAPVADANTLMIQGAVTDDPIDSATVMFHVGERQFEAARISDVNGGFEVEIEYDSLDDLVYGEALRGATNIHFLGDVTTVGDLLAQARDGMVNGGRITNITTAKFALASNATDDGQIDSYDEFLNASDGVDPERLLNVGAAIKAVVEAIDGTTLPSDVSDTLELAKGLADGSSTFIDDLNAASPGTLATSIDRLLTDGFATMDFYAEDVPGVYVSTTSLKTYALFVDGSGLANSFDDSPISRVSQWDVNADGDVALTFAQQAKVDVLQLLSATGDRRQINRKALVSNDEQESFYDVASYSYFAFEGRFDEAEVVGSYRVEQGRDFVLNVGGVGYFVDANGTVSGDLAWRVAGDGRLVLSLGNGIEQTLTRLATDDGALRVLALTTRTGGDVEALIVDTLEKS